jgi:hypothetical protein
MSEHMPISINDLQLLHTLTGSVFPNKSGKIMVWSEHAEQKTLPHLRQWCLL